MKSLLTSNKIAVRFLGIVYYILKGFFCKREIITSKKTTEAKTFIWKRKWNTARRHHRCWKTTNLTNYKAIVKWNCEVDIIKKKIVLQTSTHFYTTSFSHPACGSVLLSLLDFSHSSSAASPRPLFMKCLWLFGWWINLCSSSHSFVAHR